MKVLVVDDVADTREALGLLLGSEGHEPLFAATGREAIDVAREAKPDAILLDLGLPDIDGYEVVRLLRNHEELKSTKVFVISGWGSDEDVQRSKAAGIRFHLVKPADPELIRILLR